MTIVKFDQQTLLIPQEHDTRTINTIDFSKLTFTWHKAPFKQEKHP